MLRSIRYPNMAICALVGALGCSAAGADEPTPDDLSSSGVTQGEADRAPEADDGAGTLAAGSCLDGITNYSADGPFQYQRRTVGRVKFWVPQVPAGCKVPIVHLANGTGALCAMYGPVHQRLASHGFLSACYENANTGAGTQGIEAIDTAISTFPDLVDKKIGSTGHSQGGQASFTVLARAEEKYGTGYTYAGLAIQPASGFGAQPIGRTWQSMYNSIKSPTFMWSGRVTDGLVSQSWVRSAYNATNPSQESYFWTASGATHVPVPNTLTQQVAVAWFRWKLLGDAKACQAFKAIPDGVGSVWDQVSAKNEQPCG